jgi:Secretion system C-terminal sorting domain
MTLEKPLRQIVPTLLKVNRLSILLFAMVLCILTCGAQVTNISGIINTYHRVIEIIPAKACIRVNTTAGLALNENVMVIQMKGASVNTTNTSAFGDTISLNRAGNYEIGTICNINGDSVFLFFNLLNTYSIPDKVQLVGIPDYYSATVTAVLRAAPWNNATATGGVLALSVQEDLTLNAPISADSSGFRGGAYVLDAAGACSNFFPTDLYYYDASNLSPQQGGAYKGEGVYEFDISMSGGRGSPANGGAGGNNHNNGGGGGANLSGGGRGGGNYSTTGCSLTQLGVPAKALSNYGGQKIFLGGGGGAGHSNGAATVSNGGGHGGGIVFIYAKRLIGNNSKISANGQVGGPAVSDGASGGGGGGTIIMRVITYSGGVTIEANGGKGGDENDGLNAKRCYGPGGGGGAGVIYYSGSLPAITSNVNGGLKGNSISPDPACGVPQPALPGSNGSIVTNYTFRTSTNSSASCSGNPLPIHLLYFTLTGEQQNVFLKWKITQPDLVKNFTLERSSGLNRWETISVQNANDNFSSYDYIDKDPLQGQNLYRLKTIGKNNEISYSPIREIFIGKRNDQFGIYPNPATTKIRITGNLNILYQIKLFDITGKTLLQQKFAGNGEISLPILPRGIYILQLNEEMKKLIIR